MGMSTGLLVFEILFTFVPFLLDTGIQVWNAIEVNILTNNAEFKYPTPLYFIKDNYTSNTTANTNVCEEGWTYFSHDNQCYKFLNINTSWTNASRSCQSSKRYPSQNFAQEARLASIPDKITNDFLEKLQECHYSYKCAYAWTAGFQIGLDWYGGHWFQGPPSTFKDGYTNWGDGKPSNISDTVPNTYLAMMCDCDLGKIVWKKGQWNNVPDSYELPALCQYDPFGKETYGVERKRREVQPLISSQPSSPLKKDNIYSVNFSIKISFEGLVSLALVQLPGFVLGFLGVMKAFFNHGCSKKAVIDSLR